MGFLREWKAKRDYMAAVERVTAGMPRRTATDRKTRRLLRAAARRAYRAYSMGPSLG